MSPPLVCHSILLTYNSFKVKWERNGFLFTTMWHGFATFTKYSDGQNGIQNFQRARNFENIQFPFHLPEKITQNYMAKVQVSQYKKNLNMKVITYIFVLFWKCTFHESYIPAISI